MENPLKDKLCRYLKNLDVVYKEPNGKPIFLSGGGISDFYVDIKKAYGQPLVLEAIVDVVMEQIDSETTCVAARGYGGVPLASALAVKGGFNLTLIRDEEKRHGKGGLIDGHLPNKSDYVAIIDDVFTTGRNLRKCAEILKPTEARIVGGYVVVRRAENKLDNPEFPIKHIFTVEELLA
jgi:orotate phosphoribosyltransferase